MDGFSSIAKSILLLQILISATSSSYINKVDGNLRKECPLGEAINTFEAIYDHGAKDRQFNFGCTRVVTKATCQWTDYLNAFDKPVNRRCDGYIGGIESIHNNHFEDRRWKIQCCNPGEEIQKNRCQQTSYINKFKQTIKFALEPDQMFVGLESYHEDSHE